MKFAVDADDVGETLTNVPVYLRLSATDTGKTLE